MERWKTIGWFVFVIVALVSLVPPADDSSLTTGRPTSENERAPGLAAIVRWLRSGNFTVHSQRQRLDNISDVSNTKTGNILLTHLPSKLIFEGNEVHALLNWVQQGNTLVIATGHLESTPWIYDGRTLSHSLWRLTGLRLADENEDDDAAEDDLGDDNQSAGNEAGDSAPAAKPSSGFSIGDGLMDAIDSVLVAPGWLLVHGSRESVRLVATKPHPLTRELDQIEVPWDGNYWQQVSVVTNATDDSAEPWSADIESCAAEKADALSQRQEQEAHLPLRMLRGQQECLAIPTAANDAWQTLLQHQDSEQPALLSAPLGGGHILVLMHASLLDNEVIHRFENRQFTQNLIRQHLGPGGTMIIDDAHQGLNDILEASDLLSDSRFYASIAFVLIFWLAYLLADSGQWQRARYKAQPKRPNQRDMVFASANFLRRRLHPSAAVDAVVDPLRQRLAEKWRLPAQTALAEGLRLEAKEQPQAVAELQRLLAKAERKQSIALPALQRIVHELTRA